MYVDSEGNEDLSTVYTINKVYKSDPTKRAMESKHTIFIGLLIPLWFILVSCSIIAYNSYKAQRENALESSNVCVCECLYSDIVSDDH